MTLRFMPGLRRGEPAMPFLAVLAGAALLLTSLALPAAAHHPLGGETPMTFWHGFLSGIGHPVIGVDHLAFIIAVGVASAFVARSLLMPAAFIAATLAGCLVTLQAGILPGLEMLVAASVALIGVMILSGRTIAAPVYLALFALAGLFHGGAYAGAMVGAEPTPLVAYLAGLAIVQYAIAAAMTLATRNVWQAWSAAAIEPRLAGAVVAGVGLTFLTEHIETLALAVK